MSGVSFAVLGKATSGASGEFALTGVAVEEFGLWVDGSGVGRPHGEPHTALAGLRAELLVQPSVGALVEQVQVEVGDRVVRHRVIISVTAVSGPPTHSGRLASS